MNEAPKPLDPRGERLNAVLSAYLEANDGGWAPAPTSLLTRYPDIADDLRDFFDAEARVAAVASPATNGNGRTAPRGPQTLLTLNVRPPAPKAVSLVNAVNAEKAVGDYASLEVIKEGGMGIVYRAWQKGANRFVALKMIRFGQFATLAEVRRFRDEAEAAANLDHPNIVPIYEVGERDGLPFFSMKLFETGSLHQHLDRYTRDLPAAARLLATVCRAVHYAHQRGILHRDLKPGNILLDAQGEPHVTDFGLAKRLFPAAPPARPTGGAGHSADPTLMSPGPKQGTVASAPSDGAATVDELPADLASYVAPEQALKIDDPTVTLDEPPRSQTATGTAVGTPGYWAPESTRSAKATVTTAADVYSLGAILYRLLSGQALFPTTSRTEAVRLAREGVPDLPHKLNPKADRKLEAICMKCLRKEPAKRYSSAESLAEDLERWSNGEWPLAWTPPRPLRIWRGVRRSLPAVGLTACAMFALGVLFAIYYFDPERSAARTAAALESESRRRPVVLLGGTGGPRWSRWSLGAGNHIVWSEPGEPFGIAALERVRLELLRQAPAPSYRFAVEVKHEIGSGASEVGIYIGHSEQATADEIKRYWWDIGFADAGTLARAHDGPIKGQKYAEVRLRAARKLLPSSNDIRHTAVRELFVSSAETRSLSTWRQIAVEVRSERVRFFLDGHSFGDVTMDEMRKFGAEWVVQTRVVSPEIPFAQDGAIGLFVDHGKALFRNAIIEPLE